MAEEENDLQCLIAVRIRGRIRSSQKVRETLRMLNLNRTHHAVLIDNRHSFLGMLKIAQNYLAWGEASLDTIHHLLKKRGRQSGNKKMTDEYAQKVGYNSLEDLAEEIFNCKIQYWQLPDVRPVFRLHPPTKGFKGNIKKGYHMGGELGYRGEKINELIEKMI